MALADKRDTQEFQSGFGQKLSLVCATSQTFYQGALVMVNGSGLLVPGATAASQVCAGRAEASLVTGAGGGERLEVKSGIMKYDNDDGGTPVTQALVGQDCYILDDETVSADNTGRSVAGTVVSIEDDGQVAVAIKFPIG